MGETGDWTPPRADIEPHRTINDIRDHVTDWRQCEWPGVSGRLRNLLKFWAQEGTVMRPFWCQREAVETLIWLFDAGRTHAPAVHEAITGRIAGANQQWNEGIPRVASKMATGTGKTRLMAMIALWWAVRKPGHHMVDFVALAPGLTIRHQLMNTLADPDGEHWDAVAPGNFRRDVRRMRWTVLNFQAFQRQATLAVGGKEATGREKALLVGPGKRAHPEHWRETEAEMVDRLLKSHRGGNEIVVLNDEAHHCYTLHGARVAEGQADQEEREDRKRAELWFGALRAIRAGGRLAQVFDLSATPMWLRRPGALEAETFPWTVSDFSLLDAVESGLVKIPRVPINETQRNESGEVDHLQPRYRNIYAHNQKRDLGETLTPEVREPLREIYKHYEQTRGGYEEKGHLPVMIVVANSIRNATALFRYIAGFRDEDSGRWMPGQLPLLSNVDPETKSLLPTPRTLLVHSRLDDPPGEIGTDAISRAIIEQAEIFALDAETKEEKTQKIRDIFMTVGQKGEPGAAIRCVISVGMLTEGWDARSVTHVFGYRAFKSQLLCEQVAGRALRKVVFTGRDERQPVEYANLLGVPFAWLGGKGAADPPVPRSPVEVRSEPGRDAYRIQFPNVHSFAPGRATPRWEVDIGQLRGHRVQPHHGGQTIARGVIGDAAAFGSETGRTMRQRSIWKAAAQLVPKLDGGAEHRRSAFLASLRIVAECLPHMSCDDWEDLQHDEDTLYLIANSVSCMTGDVFSGAIFDDQRGIGTRIGDTANIQFRTTLPHWYETTKSELNAAACHSEAEVKVAEILDRHDEIAAWARNFRLFWTIPYFDPTRGGWARFEPDFVARCKHPTAEGRTRFLVIEFKGMRAGEPKEEAKRKYLDQKWIPAVSQFSENGEDLGDWKSVWIEDTGSASDQITKACRR